MMDESPQQPVTVAEVARVGIDLPCITCGYNLRSLPMSGRCTECNGTIESTLHHGWLMFADPQWLKRLRSGVTLMLWTLLATVLSYIGAFVALDPIIASSTSVPGDFLIQVCFFLVRLGISTGWLIIAFKLTTPDPAHTPGSGSRRGALASWAIALNIMPTISVIASTISFGLTATEPFPAETIYLAVLFLDLADYAAVLGSMVGFFLLMILMRRIARRVSRNGLGKLMSVLIWGSVGLGVGCVALIQSFASGVVFTGGPGMAIPTTTSAPGGIAALGNTTVTTQGNAVRSVSVTTPTATTGPATSAPTTMPVIAGGTGGLLGNWRLFSIVFTVILCLALGWGVCGLAALFWFRRVFRHAIVENAAHQIESVVRQ